MKSKNFFIFIILLFTFSSCNDDDNLVVPNSINDFVWKAMNSWYLWQADEVLLSDNQDDNQSEYLSFINSYSSPEALFEDLIYQPDIVDRFSFMTDNYEELQNSLQGITESFGHDFRLLNYDNGNVLGYVRYVIPNTPADEAGIKRGDIFTTINGTQLTQDNFFDLLFNQITYTVGFADIINNVVIPNGQEVTMTAEIVNENPVLVNTTFDLINGKKAGYLMYNGFTSQHNDELNEAFAQLQSEGITDLILDLRYNSGGSVLTATYLASMIYSTDTSLPFVTIAFNNKKEQFNSDFSFANTLQVFDSNGDENGTQPINSLGLSSLIVLTTGSTASASELIINGLLPYMPVTLIGTTTVGKNAGSITLYDSPDQQFLDVDTADPSHKYALQPLVSIVENAQGNSDYINGFSPDIEVDESDFIANLQPLGSPQEPLLREALAQLCPSCLVQPLPPNFDASNVHTVYERKASLPIYQSMTLDELLR